VSTKGTLLPAAPLLCSAAVTIAETIGTAAESVSEKIAATAEATEKCFCSLVKTKSFGTAGTFVLYLPEAV